MTEKPPAQPALAHLKVLDLSRVLAGPWCTPMLADLGADVVKVERPGVGDDTRHWGPPFLQDAQGADTAHASYFTACNRNKRSVTIDMVQPQGQALIRQMAAQSDIVVENFKVGGLAAYGLDYESLHALNPRLIYCSITGFGQSGPYAQRAGYDLMIQAMSGLMSITGQSADVPGGGPQRVGVAVVDVIHATTRSRNTADWIALLEPLAVPCGPINDIGQAFAQAQVGARSLVVNQTLAPEVRSQTAIKQIATVASPLRLMDTPPVLRRAPPGLGEHTVEVLAGLGLDVKQIAQLRVEGVI
jgi:crotonobetainyl-CoA:carnitine CoA-transferase CaiB-like acyl-CoA transferase